MIYLDYAASNPIDPRVREAMAESLAWLGNPSSVHAAGRKVRESVDAARDAVAGLLGVLAHEITFTSGATEANNTALLGYFRRLRELYGRERELHLLVSPIEHSSVRDTVRRLQSELQVEVDRMPVDGDGVVRAEKVGELVTDKTVMVCVMWANNIVGSLQPMAEIASQVSAARQGRGAGSLPLALMSDAVQALRTEDVRPAEIGVDILTVSAHKIYGPKGCGALYIRKGIEIAPLITGGGQEFGQRAGTENISGIAGFGKAAEILTSERDKDRQHAVRLTRILREGMRTLADWTVIGDAGRTVPGILYAVGGKAEGDVLTLKLDAMGIAVSSGSACDAGTRKTASVLREICSGQTVRRGGIRLSFGRFSTEQDVTDALGALAAVR